MDRKELYEKDRECQSAGQSIKNVDSAQQIADDLFNRFSENSKPLNQTKLINSLLGIEEQLLNSDIVKICCKCTNLQE